MIKKSTSKGHSLVTMAMMAIHGQPSRCQISYKKSPVYRKKGKISNYIADR